MRPKSPRIAVRGLLVHQGRLLLVNAWPGNRSTLLCAPGGGVEPGSSLPDNLAREFYEETGLRVRVGEVCLVNEFHNPDNGFHQIDLFFRCAVDGPATIDPNWQDPENVVNRHVWAAPEDATRLKAKPDSLFDVAFGTPGAVSYDPLERVVM